MCFVEVLYYTALKCRAESTRWRAVRLLGQTGKEGVWEGTIMRIVAEFVVKNEEVKRVLIGDESEEIREEDRIHGTVLNVRREQREVGVTCSKGRILAGGVSRENAGERNGDYVWEFSKAVLKY